MKAQLIVCIRAYRKKFIMERFIDQDDIFALVIDGSFEVKTEKESFIVQKNEGMLFRKNTIYYRRVLTPVTMYLFRYKSRGHAFDKEHVKFCDQVRLASTIASLEQLNTDVYIDDFEYHAHLFFDLSLQYRMENRLTLISDDPIKDAINKIRQTLHLCVNLEKIGAESGLSYVQFLRRFKNYTGMPPSVYIIALRIQKAKELLANTDLLIKEISTACGFENEYYFSNFFKKHTSLSPSTFRKASRS